MKIVHKYPPNIEKIKEVFPLQDGVVFTYGDKLYNPDKAHIDDALMRHEETHTKQQGDNPDEWWEKYLADPEFRAEQELEAYRNQYQYALEHWSRPARRLLLKRISKDLSSPLYGSLMTREEAKFKIKHYSS